MKVLYVSKGRIRVMLLVMSILLLAALLTGNGKDSLKSVFSSPASSKVIVIDPGHGGIDSGAVGVSGAREDELNLKVALKLKNYLTEHGATVILTRETNKGLASRKSDDMRKRREIIKESNADIVVSIHMNKFTQAKYFGAQTFYMKGSIKGEELARHIQTRLVEDLIENNIRKIKAVDNFLVLKASSAPSVLVECGFLSNPREEALLKTDEYQEKVAWSIYCGILEYFASQESFNWDGASMAYGEV